MKSRNLGVAALSAGLGTSAVVGGFAYAIGGRSSQMFGPSVYKGTSGRRSIALTFDDGPSSGSLRLLEVLSRENVPATFFQCGLNILRHSGIARELYAEGHEIGNHTYSHPRLCPRIGWQINWQSPRSIFLAVRSYATDSPDRGGSRTLYPASALWISLVWNA